MHDCEAKATCFNSPGSFRCECNIGFKGIRIWNRAKTVLKLNCHNINECTEGTHHCGEHTVYTDNSGSYACACVDGYILVDGVCQNFIKCEAMSSECDYHARCVDTDGSYDCVCNIGYTGDGFMCRNVDECQQRRYKWTFLDRNIGEAATCPVNSDCFDNEGSFYCVCQTGYISSVYSNDNITIACEDINECTVASGNLCSENSSCRNTDGSYDCVCNNGYEGDGYDSRSACENIDECKQDRGDCGANAYCSDNEGSYECICKDGFISRGKGNCDDIDECEARTHDCNANAACINTVSNYNCECNDG